MVCGSNGNVVLWKDVTFCCTSACQLQMFIGISLYKYFENLITLVEGCVCIGLFLWFDHPDRASFFNDAPSQALKWPLCITVI